MVFAVGETLVDETRSWSALADEAGVTRLALFAALGALIERGEDHRGVWDLLSVERPASSDEIAEAAFYPDALPCRQAVRAAGYTVGLAGNQPAAAETALGRLGLPIHFIASSARWGVEMFRWPSPQSLIPQSREARQQVGSSASSLASCSGCCRLLEQPCDVRLMGPRRLERHVRIGPSPAPETVEELQRGYS